MKKVICVAQNTFKEIIRDRVLYALIFFAVFLVVLSYLMGQLSFAEENRIVTNMGLVAIQLGCCLLAVFLGSTLVSREIEKQTVLTLLSKPLSRSEFIAGKFLGLTAILTLMNFALSGILFLICRNYEFFKIKTFAVAQMGTYFESLVILSVAIFFGVFCRPMLTVLFTFSTWIIGHAMLDLDYFSKKSDNEVFHWFGSFFSKYFINLSRFDFKEAVIYNDPINKSDVYLSIALWLSWMIILIFCAQRLFKSRDFV